VERRQQWRPTAAGQSFAAVCAGAEADHQTGVTAMTLAVLSVFDQYARGK
jgi:hypothetical protein